MKQTVVVYGSSTGTCESVAQAIAQKLGVQVIDVSALSEGVIQENDNLILGTSTWGAGEMQDDWYDGVNVLKKAGLAGKTVALFGCGDCESYGDTFCGGMHELYEAVTEAGAHVIGAVDASHYTYEDSESVIDGKFVGLAIDEVNESDKTEERIDQWLSEIKPSL
ncbi:MAG: flavodoxin FldA [Prevotella sp.]|jgi:flavodoxin I|nr:flavodoxin FldA [Prevotella sp.]MCI2079352.1 flavodoxin FldA [Prevotella sp.]MCI2101217.1 flavodoxin FldA [Prevotella sp.]